jgi:hypothetical protein
MKKGGEETRKRNRYRILVNALGLKTKKQQAEQQAAKEAKEWIEGQRAPDKAEAAIKGREAKLLSKIIDKITHASVTNNSQDAQAKLLEYVNKNADADADDETLEYLKMLNGKNSEDIIFILTGSREGLDLGPESTIDPKTSIDNLESVIINMLDKEKSEEENLVPIFKEYIGTFEGDEKIYMLEMFKNMGIDRLKESLRHYRDNKKGGRKTRHRRKKSRKQSKSKFYV